ncbi:S-methyl-5-thioribose-1-phosphate isomerase [Streptomyces sp. AJS327]|uniref:S-methyl-5-thioribose-1-phosphate isomerase n=1 Tax=Streptomyces sp. AJS327 TaxID=2545265 RepID=UPI0015DE79F6|nr:S-methyl-5-thioribose-1-phosphate isomerase [Streptomyces sp. AJS327]MBA0049488.1 S-methyl-5-thioribose-1-phosphate isomerase [Streptomyces sp. AJS327]
MAGESVPTLRWVEPPTGPAVGILDQTRLPAEEVELVCADVPSLVEAIQRLAVRGAPALGLTGAYGVALAAVRGADVAEAADLLAYARPTAVNLGYGVRRTERAYREALGRGAAEAAAAALAEARTLHREDAEAAERMAAHGRTLLRELLPEGPMRLLTHCNTGALVSGGRGTALGVVSAVHEAGELRKLWIDETRPLLQGARLTAYEAVRAGMDHAVLADGAAGSLFGAGEVDAVLIGADRVAADGSVANKVGSYPLAVLARYHRVPFIVVAPVSTVDPETERGADIEVEHRSGDEVTWFGSSSGEGRGVRTAPAGAAAYNPAFDVTPPELVSAIVTERGVVSPVTGEGLAALCSTSRRAEPRSGNGMMSS